MEICIDDACIFADGRMGKFRLEVIGEKKQGILVTPETHSCNKSRICFNEAKWIDETGETAVRDTD